MAFFKIHSTRFIYIQIVQFQLKFQMKSCREKIRSFREQICWRHCCNGWLFMDRRRKTFWQSQDDDAVWSKDISILSSSVICLMLKNIFTKAASTLIMKWKPIVGKIVNFPEGRTKRKETDTCLSLRISPNLTAKHSMKLKFSSRFCTNKRAKIYFL